MADAYLRIDPAKDGWQTEAFSEVATGQLSRLSRLLESSDEPRSELFDDFVTDAFTCSPWIAPDHAVEDVLADASLRVRRAGRLEPPNNPRGPAALAAVAQQLARQFSDRRPSHVKLKLYRVNRRPTGVQTAVLMQASGPCEGGSVEFNAKCQLEWTADATLPQLKRFAIESWEESRWRGDQRTMFVDCTDSVAGKTDAHQAQLRYSTDHWRSRLPRILGLDASANHGLALADVNGDDLEDLYVCAQGGLPNRLLLQNRDGTLRDASAQSGADWLDSCSCALLIDLDNDGDRDLVIAQELAVHFMSNDGSGRFELVHSSSRNSQTLSLSAADYDLDGDLDIYSCGYDRNAFAMRAGAMGEPMPYHDAVNGGRNVLLRNDGDWQFTDATQPTGLHQNNARFSYAASWEDYDNDGDADLYVANDYGRNNLYRNDSGRFTDVAGELNVEDVSSGMSACWGDYDRDGWMDLYVSNMFSAAGNRITYQREFKSDADDQVRRDFQRLAHGNTLFRNTGDGGFVDATDEAGVWQGRWAWGSRFADINGDGWEDLLVANGFVTTEDSGDL